MNRLRWFIREAMIGWHQGGKEKHEKRRYRHEMAEMKWRCSDGSTRVEPALDRRPKVGVCPGCGVEENRWCAIDCPLLDPMDYR